MEPTTTELEEERNAESRGKKPCKALMILIANVKSTCIKSTCKEHMYKGSMSVRKVNYILQPSIP